MRFPGWYVLAVVASCVLWPKAQARAEDYQVSYAAGLRDQAGHFMGGYRNAPFWNRACRQALRRQWLLGGSAGTRKAARHRKSLVLDGSNTPWRVDHAFDDRQPNGRLRDLAVGALAEANFATDLSGAKLPRPVSLLVASTWDLTGAARVFTRNDATGVWTAVTLAQDRSAPDFLPQIRAFGTHRDRVTGADLVFAGEMPHGIFAGSYDPVAPGHIRWKSTPELDATGVSTAFSGLAGRLRVSSFAEANDRIYAAVGQQVFERIDGRIAALAPCLYQPHGLGIRKPDSGGLTAIRTPTGH